MKDPVYVNVEGEERTLKALGQSVAVGLANALKGITQRTCYTNCVRLEKTSLRDMLRSASMATGALEIRYQAGLTGAALLLVRSGDLFRLAELVLGKEVKMDDRISPEVMETSVKFFERALEAAGKKFALEHDKRIQASAPELINPDGRSESLEPLAAAYDNVVCLTFQLIVEPQLDSSIHLLAQRELLTSLVGLIPEYDAAAAQAAGDPFGSGRDTDDDTFVAGSEVTGLRASGETERRGGKWNVDLILDVDLPVVVTFGSTEMQLKDILKLGVGSVIELDKGVNDPVTLVVNEKAIARGEVVMVDGNYGVRILQVESTAERIRSMG